MYSLDTIHQHKSLSRGHHQNWIIIITSPTILRKWFHLSILLVIGSYTKPSLFHVGCRPSLHVGLHLLYQLYLAMGGTHPTSMSERPAQHLYLTMGETHPTSMSERHAQNSHMIMGGPSCHHVKKAQHSHPSAW